MVESVVPFFVCSVKKVSGVVVVIRVPDGVRGES